MRPMFLGGVEQAPPQGAYAGPINGMRAAGIPVPQIMHLFAFKPDRTNHLAAFTQGVNKWIDATGVADMPAEAYEMSGERLALGGYVPQG